MYSSLFLPLIIKHVQFTSRMGSFPFEFDPKSRKLIRIKDLWRVRVTQVQSVITLIYYLIMLYNFFFGELPVLKRLQGFPFIIFYTILVSCGWNVGLDIAPMQLINSILTFERDLLHGMM